MALQFRYSTFLTIVTAFAAIMLLIAYSATTSDIPSNPQSYYLDLQTKFKEAQAPSQPPSTQYDIVTLVHHSDMAPFIAYGLRSWIVHLKDLSQNANIFIICNPQAYDAVEFHLQQEEASGHETDHNIIPIHEEIYPFSLESVTNEFTWDKKPTWIYQQLLKLYSHQVLTKQHEVDPLNVPLIKEWFTIIDSDTVFVKPFSLFDTYKGQPYPLYNVANVETGAFSNDAILGQALIDEVFEGMNMKKAFPTHQGNTFTAIAHLMTFHGPTLKAMLDKMDEIHGMASWKFLCRLRRSVLSEWEMYLAWVMHHQRETVLVRPIPYVNWGKLEHTNLISLNNKTLSDIVYLSKHDDYQVSNKCCVNSNWQRKSGLPNCPCCQKPDCTRIDINCNLLGGNEGCKVIDVNSDGAHTMTFEPKTSEDNLKQNPRQRLVSNQNS